MNHQNSGEPCRSSKALLQFPFSLSKF
uniref:Uncharacterized protein n=1 Tax=Rhizophora mucronata TaxID=61149 RepID=A0A2P2R5E2_RHIMU